jgi:hypothetical protein
LTILSLSSSIFFSSSSLHAVIFSLLSNFTQRRRECEEGRRVKVRERIIKRRKNEGREERKITVSQMRFPRMSLLIRVSVLGNKQ